RDRSSAGRSAPHEDRSMSSKTDMNEIVRTNGKAAGQAMFDRAGVATDEKAAPRFRLIPFAELRPRSEPAYLIKGLIPRRGLTVIWGPPKCGKSFWTFDALAH